MVGIELGREEGEGSGKKMGKGTRVELWKDLGKEVSMEMGGGWKEGEQGVEHGDKDVGEDGRWQKDVGKEVFKDVRREILNRLAPQPEPYIWPETP